MELQPRNWGRFNTTMWSLASVTSFIWFLFVYVVIAWLYLCGPPPPIYCCILWGKWVPCDSRLNLELRGFPEHGHWTEKKEKILFLLFVIRTWSLLFGVFFFSLSLSRFFSRKPCPIWICIPSHSVELKWLPHRPWPRVEKTKATFCCCLGRSAYCDGACTAAPLCLVVLENRVPGVWRTPRTVTISLKKWALAVGTAKCPSVYTTHVESSFWTSRLCLSYAINSEDPFMIRTHTKGLCATRLCRAGSR